MAAAYSVTASLYFNFVEIRDNHAIMTVTSLILTSCSVLCASPELAPGQLLAKNSHQYAAQRTFTASHPELNGNE